MRALHGKLVALPDLIQIAVIDAGLVKGSHIVDDGTGCVQNFECQWTAAAFAQPHSKQKQGLQFHGIHRQLITDLIRSMTGNQIALPIGAELTGTQRSNRRDKTVNHHRAVSHRCADEGSAHSGNVETADLGQYIDHIVFIRLIERVISDGKGIIVMVPEISLTPQFVSQFAKRFGDKIAVFHSALSLGERLDEYKRVKQGLAQIVIGTRSAVFAPFEKVGLIIMDEEQEYSYKSESSPRYHARDIAKFRCSCNNALLVLSSATPSVETYYYAQTGRYSLNTLSARYGTAVLPEVVVADMGEELKNGNTSGFSDVLLQNLAYNIEHKKQSILLLNRRGYNTFVTCPACGEAVSCPNCSISLTYHSANNRLMCHYCGYSVPYTDECPVCHSHRLTFGGTGTQRAEKDISDIFPEARILRMDTDATSSKSSYEKMITSFANGDYDILVGTQMVAKGLNFPNVTLVGVLNADHMLYADDYRSYERSFSLLTQVVGRSGRGKDKGMAVIQTHTPDNLIISMAARQDYNTSYSNEIKVRKAMLYPPFADICLVGFVSQNRELTLNGAKKFLAMFTGEAKKNYPNIPLRILGPSPALVVKISNKYRYKIIIKCKNNSDFRALLSKILCEFGKDKEFSGVTAYADMNALVC